uniref:Uncharacterized protein n=1 Tax=Desertifilum tharense IPPAS B-1220 TaxID=1781255 RepID=A0A1E5QKH8_9CYAN|nr:hypothetical protein BH720_10680 [Desertifilum tharense IPPAS B-1220]
MQRSFFSAEWGRRELGVGSWGLGKKGIGSWELGVGEEEDGGMGGWGDGGKLQTQHSVETQHTATQK